MCITTLATKVHAKHETPFEKLVAFAWASSSATFEVMTTFDDSLRNWEEIRLVNNAGMITKSALEDDDNSLSIWKETLQVNLHAPLLLSKLAKEKMQEGGGVIINVSSIHGERSNEFMGAYAASKAGLDSLTRTLAIEWAEYNIRVNAVAPGVVPVEKTEAAFQDPQMSQGWLTHLPLNKLGTVEEVADAVVPLITNDWVTGAIWTIDGGMMARCNMPFRARPEKPPATRVPIDSEVELEE